MTEIKLTVDTIIASQVSLVNITDKELPVLTAWKLARVVRNLENEISAYEGARVPLVKKYGEKDEMGNWSVLPKHNEAFQNEIREVLEQEVVVDIPLISLEALGEANFKPRDLALAWFIFEEEHNESSTTDEEGQ